jgi:hypothetical protein
MFGRRRRNDEEREFNRQLLMRFEQTARNLGRAADEHAEQLRLAREESRAYHERETKRLDEILEAHRDHRRSLLSVLDRLDNGGTAPAG